MTPVDLLIGWITGPVSNRDERPAVTIVFVAGEAAGSLLYARGVDVNDE